MEHFNIPMSLSKRNMNCMEQRISNKDASYERGLLASRRTKAIGRVSESSVDVGRDRSRRSFTTWSEVPKRHGPPHNPVVGLHGPQEPVTKNQNN